MIRIRNYIININNSLMQTDYGYFAERCNSKNDITVMDKFCRFIVWKKTEKSFG